jgi:hypothetical protein
MGLRDGRRPASRSNIIEGVAGSLPSPKGRGWTATGAFTSRRGTGEGSIAGREGIRWADEVTPHLARSARHSLPKGAVSELAKSRFLERIINNLRCAKVQNI